MIELHHFGSDPTPFKLNPDLIMTVEARPDTIIHLVNGHEFYVAESPDEVEAAVLAWKIKLVSQIQSRGGEV